MAVDMFLKIDKIEGEALDEKHGKEIEVLSWSWGMSQSGSTHMGSGGGTGKVDIQDLSITKWVDRSSPTLMKACCKGTHFKEALLTVRKAGDTPLEYIKIKMQDGIISSVSTGGSGGEDRLTENVTLNFAKVSCDYTPQKPDGTKMGEVSMGWDIPKNVEI